VKDSRSWWYLFSFQFLYLIPRPHLLLHTHKATMTSKTAYVTGGASGIGLAVAHALNQRGMRIVIADINLAGAQEAASKLQQSTTAGQEHFAVEVDVSSWESQLAAFEKTLEVVQRLDIVIVNAGVTEAVFVPNDGGKGQGFVKPNLRTLDINLNGFLYTSALAIQQMRRQEIDADGIRGRSESKFELVGNAWLTFFDKLSVPRLCAGSTAYQVSMSLARTVQNANTFAALPVYTAAKQ
jgi:NAD(P)-dependent dehydrogenase (short-subunit alcohol dehydrogenase family)